MNTGKMLLQIMERTGKHQKEIGAELGVTQNQVSRWINTNSKPHARFLGKIKKMHAQLNIVETKSEFTTEDLVKMLNDRGYTVTLTR